MGVFDEGCMGMYNAIIPDELLHPTGVFKERLSQSALYAAMTVSDAEGAPCAPGSTPRHEVLTGPIRNRPDRRQILQQCKMYIAAVRIADEFGCDAIGIQYQQGSRIWRRPDLVEGLLNNVDRPPVRRARQRPRILYEGKALPHFNEVDECAGLDALVTNRVWPRLGFDPKPRSTTCATASRTTTARSYVWVFEISGAAPPRTSSAATPARSSERQPPMYFRLGGGTLKGISKPGEIVWSRVFVETAG
jgi:hypothetical protein